MIEPNSSNIVYVVEDKENYFIGMFCDEELAKVYCEIYPFNYKKKLLCIDGFELLCADCLEEF